MKKSVKVAFVLGAIVGACLLCTHGCSFIAPNVSKAQTEGKQLKQLEKSNELMAEQNELLKRIAVAIESK